MIAILGLVVLIVFVLAFFIGRTQEKLWMRWGLIVAAVLGAALWVVHLAVTPH